MMHLTLEDIRQLEKRHRANLINSITGVKSANLIGTRNKEGKTNLSIVSSVVHLGSNPALIGYIQRPRGVERHTFENIISTKKYTINAINSAIIHPAHKTSARYPREKSEFEETGLTPEWLNDFYAPFVKESNIKIAMELVEVIPIPMNDTELVVGKVLEVYFPSTIYKTDGHLAVYESGTVGISGLDTYLSTEKIARYSYAKPDEPIIEI
jgi:flavin reductase (DIM6/NTAB) family NADH-FMN oxidoreductase RutF